MDRLQNTIEALLHVHIAKPTSTTPTNNSAIPTTPIPTTPQLYHTQPTQEEQDAQGDPNPDDQYNLHHNPYPPIPRIPASVLASHIPSPLTPALPLLQFPKPTTGNTVSAAPPGRHPTSNSHSLTIQAKQSSPPTIDRRLHDKAGRSKPLRSSPKAASPKTRSPSGVMKLWMDPNSAPDPVFDEWKLVEKKGKRSAETSNIGVLKRTDNRTTPTKMKTRPKIQPAEPEKKSPGRHYQTKKQ